MLQSYCFKKRLCTIPASRFFFERCRTGSARFPDTPAGSRTSAGLQKRSLLETSLHPAPHDGPYADVILPLAVGKPYTYAVPADLAAVVRPGIRVEVQFAGDRLYAGMVLRVHGQAPAHRTRAILSSLDAEPLLTENILAFWEWLSAYYGCSLGEVMEAALPAGLKLSSERRLVLCEDYAGDPVAGLSDKEYLVYEALTFQETLTIDEVRQLLQQKTVMPLVKRLIDRRVIVLQESLTESYQPRKVSCVRLAKPYRDDPRSLQDAFGLCTRSERQTAALLAYVQLRRQQGGEESVLRARLYEQAKVDAAVLAAMARKGIFELFEREVSRFGGYEETLAAAEVLTERQEAALAAIDSHFGAGRTVLLHGVTGSGKTNIYLKLIEAALARGEQVLYLLPEVALTAHAVGRLQRHFGDRIGIYHHRVSPQERVERWLSVRGPAVSGGPAAPCILGARSALFLPFTRLGLVIVDEEHDSSFKQTEPAPRYHGRDAAIYLAHLHGAKVLLGTATPSVESYRHARSGKYGLVELTERFGGLALPTVELVDMRAEAKERPLQSHFSIPLLERIKETVARGEQVILFRNRRGYAPTFRCQTCGWHAACIHCDVSLTYHQIRRQLLCHYCGYQAAVATHCPACGGTELKMQGFGTEKIEDELKIYLPDARIGRMDYDTVRGKDALSRLLNDFEEGRLDVLIGTQMVTKGLDFGNVGLVGVVSADQLLQFPDFRATERAFQLMVQVAGRAGRKEKRGSVLIQTSQVSHPILRDVIGHDYRSFYDREIQEREAFQYPPFARLIKVTLRHKRPEVLNAGTLFFADLLRQALQDRVLGPSIPPVGRVRNQFLLDIMIKMEMDSALWMRAKQVVSAAAEAMRQREGCSGIRVQVDVDPY